MSTAIEQHIAEANKQYASEYHSSGLALPPSKKATIVTCMDARLAPEAAYGLPLGSVNIIRNAGGSARDALRSLLLSNHLLGTEEVLIVKHTKCGLLGATNEMGRELLKANLGIKESEELDNMDFLPIEDLEKATKDDVEYYRNHKLRLAKVKVSGWIHDVDTGIVKKIVE